jgi:excinuclease ABC subunit A
LVFEGSVEEMLAADTLTARFLKGTTTAMARRHASRRRRETGGPARAEALRDRPGLVIVGAAEHNLRGIDVTIPRGSLVAVTGVSGSGKSTLVGDVLYEGYRQQVGEAGAEPGRCVGIQGFDRFREVLFVDQNPLGRSSRSNPVSFVGAYDALRQLYARAPAAAARRLTPGHFSFNVDKGRCPACKGTGEEEVDLQFLGTLTVVCDRCRGRRFRPEVLAVTLHGHSIAQALDLTVREAIETFSDHGPLTRRLEVLVTVGLDYLRLGQPTSTLSAGEAQRLKLAEFLRARRQQGGGGRLLLFDEPTTGLHLSDIAKLYKALRALVDKGDTVVLVEHQMDLVARTDWIVDLGPGGGRHGGDLLFCGPLQDFLEAEVDSPTREELRRVMGYGGTSERRDVGTSSRREERDVGT